jgi:annexin A7/11
MPYPGGDPYGMPNPNQQQYGGYPPSQPPAPQYGGYPPSQPPQYGGGYSNQPPMNNNNYGGNSSYPNYSNYDNNANSGYPPYQPPAPTGYPTPNPYPPAPASYPTPNPYPPATNQYPTNPSIDQFHNNPSLYPQIGQQQQPNYNNNNYGGGGQSASFQHQQTFYEGTVKPFGAFNPMDDAAKLYKAMKGFGTDETVLIDILCRRSYNQRKEIAVCYKTSYGKDLLENLKSELKGNLELVFKALMKSPAELEAHDLKKAIDGAGTDEEAVIDVMCTKTNSEMQELKQAYKTMYHKDLERDVSSDVSGYFKRFIVSLAAAHRSDNPADMNKAAQQANELYGAGAKQLGTDEVTFNRIFASESFPHLKLVFDEYYKRTGSDIEKAVKAEMSGYVEKAFCALIGTARNPPGYYAQRLHDAMSGAGTKDRTLVRIIVTRSEKDMVQIKQEFQRKYGKTLESFVKSDCTGDYERALRCLIGDPSWR